jgi:site-specific DNA recombinase
VYYRCIGTDKYRHGGVKTCTNASVKGGLEETVWSDLCSLLQEPDRLRREFERRLEQPTQDPEDRTRVQEAIKQSKRCLARLLDAYADGWVDKPEFERRMASAKQKLASQEETLAQHDQAALHEEELRLVITEFEGFAQQMTAGLEQADFATQRKLLRLLINRIEVSESDVRIVYKVPLRPFVDSPFRGGVLQDCLKFHIIAQGSLAPASVPWVRDAI